MNKPDVQLIDPPTVEVTCVCGQEHTLDLDTPVVTCRCQIYYKLNLSVFMNRPSISKTNELIEGREY